jgi:hypothetical protein
MLKTSGSSFLRLEPRAAGERSQDQRQLKPEGKTRQTGGAETRYLSSMGRRREKAASAGGSELRLVCQERGELSGDLFQQLLIDVKV